MNKEHPIIFDAESVNAILAGRKTQTRIPMRPQPHPDIDAQHGNDFRGRAPYQMENPETGQDLGFGFMDDEWYVRSPYGRPGDHLWVRETTWQKPGDPLVYHCAADRFGDAQQLKKKGFRKIPSRIMDRSLSRITLEVVSVRVERVQEITEADCVAEGVGDGVTHRPGFHRRWDAINGKRSPWASNPWVWVVEFRRMEGGER